MSGRVPSRKVMERAYVTDRVRHTKLTAGQAREEFKAGIAVIEREAAARALAEVRSTIGAYQENGVWAFDQAVAIHVAGKYAESGLDLPMLSRAAAPEPEWEYQWGEPGESFEGFDSYATEELARAEMELDSEYPSHSVMRRRKAGPWEPLQVGSETDGE